MPKYYVWSNSSKMIIQKEDAIHAAVALYISKNGQELGKYIHISEVGFDPKSGHPEHKNDSRFTSEFVLSISEAERE